MPKKIIIGLIGETGSGKDTFCDQIKKTVKEPVFCFRFSDLLSEILLILFGEVKKEDQQWLGKVLREQYGNDILARATARKIKNIENGIVILNGIRYWEEFEMVKKLGGKNLYITADQKMRWQRINKRGEKIDDFSSYEKFLEKEKAKTEILVPEIGKKADFIIENNGSMEDFFKKIDTIIKSLK
jgi:dephospho-CoA kinase